MGMKRIVGVAGIMLIVGTFVLVVFGVLSWEYFWYVAAITGILAWLLRKF